MWECVWSVYAWGFCWVGFGLVGFFCLQNPVFEKLNTEW